MNRSRAWAGGCVSCQIRVAADPTMGEESAGGAAPPSAAMISFVVGERLRFSGGKVLYLDLMQRRPLPHPPSLLRRLRLTGGQTPPRGTGDHAKLLAAAPSASDSEVAVLPGRKEIVPDLAQADPTPDQAPGRAQVTPCQIRRGTPLCKFRHRGKRRGAPRQIRRTGERCGTPRQGPGAGRGCTEGPPRQIKRMEVRGGPPRHVKQKGRPRPTGVTPNQARRCAASNQAQGKAAPQGTAVARKPVPAWVAGLVRTLHGL